MCFSSGGGTPTPTPTYATRFEYNRPVPGTDSQRARVSQASQPNTPSLGSETLGGTPQPAAQPSGGY
jgi:hypothetical protein